MTDLTLAVRNDTAPIPSITQQLRDHRAILNGYLDTHVTRNHKEATRLNEKRFFDSWFHQQGSGERPLSVWKAMEPIQGRERIIAYTKRVLETGALTPGSVMGRLGMLRRLFDYILEWPYIPDSGGIGIRARYGAIDQPVLAYDYPAHVWHGRKEDAPFVRSELLDFYEVLRSKWITRPKRPWVPARTYSMIVVAGESGLRINEICTLEVERDLLFSQGRLQTRHGKAFRGSGSRVRQTVFTPFAQATVLHYIDNVRPRFKRWSQSPFVFLSERGGPLSEDAAASTLQGATKIARQEGLRVPPRFGWHSLRRSFATIFIEEHPNKYASLMEMLGHINPSTLSHYIHHRRAYHERIMDDVVSRLICRR